MSKLSPQSARIMIKVYFWSLFSSQHNEEFCTYIQLEYLRAIGFNLSNRVTNTIESSSVLIYSELHTGLYTQEMGLDAVLIKS